MMFLRGELMRYGLQADDFDTYRASDYAYSESFGYSYMIMYNVYC